MRWGVRSTLGLIVVMAVVKGVFATGTPGVRVVGMLGALATTAAGMGVAGLTHRFARRLIARRPWGTYLYGVLIGESYLFTILGALTVAKWLGVPGLTHPEHIDAFEDWRHWRVVVVSGVVVGLIWGFLSRNDLVIGSND